jgi:hypothetical protein
VHLRRRRRSSRGCRLGFGLWPCGREEGFWFGVSCCRREGEEGRRLVVYGEPCTGWLASGSVRGPQGTGNRIVCTGSRIVCTGGLSPFCCPRGACREHG